MKNRAAHHIRLTITFMVMSFYFDIRHHFCILAPAPSPVCPPHFLSVFFLINTMSAHYHQRRGPDAPWPAPLVENQTSTVGNESAIHNDPMCPMPSPMHHSESCH